MLLCINSVWIFCLILPFSVIFFDPAPVRVLGSTPFVRPLTKATQRRQYTYSFRVIGLQVDDVIVWEGLPRFTEQIPITIKTLGKDIKKKGTNVDRIDVTTEMTNMAIKLKTTRSSSRAGSHSSVFKFRWLYFSEALVLNVACKHTIIWQPEPVWFAVCSLWRKVTDFLLPVSSVTLPLLFLAFPFPLHLCAWWGNNGPDKAAHKSFCFSTGVSPLMSSSGTCQHATDLSCRKLCA